MKKLLVIILLSQCFFASAQKIINQPKCGIVNTGGLVIDKVILTDTATQLFFAANYPEGFRISSDSYIVAGGQKLPAKSISGIAYNQYYQTKIDKQHFVITFPAIKSNTKGIDYHEGDCDDCFKVLDIALIKTIPNPLPENLYTNWFKTTDGKDWVLSLSDKRAVYKGVVWQYQPVKPAGKAFKITLIQGKTKRAIMLASAQNDDITITEAGKPPVLLTHVRGDVKYPASNQPGFTKPLIKADSSTFTGFINGYSPKLGYKTGKATINNVISGKQVSYVIPVAADGSFSVKLPTLYPQICFVEFPGSWQTVFLEPGKKLFEFLDFKHGGSSTLYFGEDARLNEELSAAKYANDFGYNTISNLALNNTPARYSELIDSLATKNLKALDNNLSAKAREVIKMEILYCAAGHQLDYNSHRESAYRQLHKIADTVRTEAIAPIKLEKSYYSFLNKLPLDNSLSIVSEKFDNFLNHLKYSEPAKVAGNLYVVSCYLDAFKQVPPANDDERKIKELFTEAWQQADDNKIFDVFEKNRKVIAEVIKSRQSVFDKMQPADISKLRDDALKGITSANMTFALNLMKSQDKIRLLEQNTEAFKADDLAKIKDAVSDESIYNIIVKRNNEIKATIERNKHSKFMANKLPNSPAEQVFNDIIKKYKGKVVYVDFWATWCGPCRANIEQVAPLKAELKAENIVFVYITDGSSPMETYKSMAPGIKGEHFRVSSDQWNYLSGKFKISGIPHHVLVNKKGEVVNPDFETEGNSDLRDKLLATLKE